MGVRARAVTIADRGVAVGRDPARRSSDAPPGDLPDAFLAIASSTAVGRVHLIDGPAEQSIRGLAASPDGLAWLMVDNQPLDDERRVVMRLGGHEFHDEGTYVFAIVP